MFTVTELSHPGAYEVRVSGRISEDDYEDVLIPALDRAIEEHDSIRILLTFAPDFETFSLGAMLDDAEFGMRHWNGFDRVAVVIDKGWTARAIRAFSVLIPCPVMMFKPGQEDDARRWLASSLGSIHQTDLGNGVLHVQLLGKLDSAVYEREMRDLETFMRANADTRLLIDLSEFDGWQGLGALGRHLRLAVNHRNVPSKIAIVGDATWQKMGERILANTSEADTAYYDSAQIDAAKAWLAA